MGATIIILLVFCLATVIVDGCPVFDTVNGTCCEITKKAFKFSVSLKSRVYNITNFCGDCEVAEGYCDGTTAGGGWIVVQRRQDGSVNFIRDWVDYENGFGSLTGEFWYGLTPLHCLTNQGQWEMRIDFTLTDGTKSYLSYTSFKVGPASSKYRLSISGFKGITEIDPFSQYKYMMLNGTHFTTKDRDNDKWESNCAKDHLSNAGGWWYDQCSAIYINYQSISKNIYGKMIISTSGSYKDLSFTEMKIRPINCNM